MTDGPVPPPPPVVPPAGPPAVPPAVPCPSGKLPKGALIAAPIVFVVTAVVGIVMIALSLVTVVNAVGDFRQVRAGETRTLALDPGDWYVVAGGPRGTITEVRVQVVDQSGRPVPALADYDSVNVDLDGQRYEAIGAFAVTRSGVYEVTVDGPPGTEARIGRVPLTRFVVLLVGGIVIGGLGFLVAIVLLIVGLVVRSNAKKRRAASAPPAPTT